jgi:hypothetical protein
MVFGKTLAVVAIVAGTSAGLSGGTLGWPSCSRTHFWTRNAFRALLGPSTMFTLWGQVPSESLSSSDSSVLFSSSSLSTSTFVRFKPPCGNLSTPVGMSGSSGIVMFLAYLIMRQSTFFINTALAHTIGQM